MYYAWWSCDLRTEQMMARVFIWVALFYVLVRQARSQCEAGSTNCKCIWKSYTLDISNAFTYPWVLWGGLYCYAFVFSDYMDPFENCERLATCSSCVCVREPYEGCVLCKPLSTRGVWTFFQPDVKVPVVGLLYVISQQLHCTLFGSDRKGTRVTCDAYDIGSDVPTQGVRRESGSHPGYIRHYLCDTFRVGLGVDGGSVLSTSDGGVPSLMLFLLSRAGSNMCAGGGGGRTERAFVAIMMAIRLKCFFAYLRHLVVWDN